MIDRRSVASGTAAEGGSELIPTFGSWLLRVVFSQSSWLLLLIWNCLTEDV